MKIAMTLLVRDEDDILESNIEYHLSMGVDFIIATDNRSEDGTQEILRSYERRGLLRYLYEADDDYNQAGWVTRMARMAHVEHAADWVINNDADEFWWPLRGATLRATLEAVDPGVSVVEAQRHNFVVTATAGPFFDAMPYREAASLNLFGKPLPPKVAHRGSAQVLVAQGNHSVEVPGFGATSRGDIEILHFPVRSYQQLENKIAKGGAAYEQNQVLDRGIGATWRSLYEQFKQRGDLRAHFAEIVHDDARLAARLERGEIVVDRRLADWARGARPER